MPRVVIIGCGYWGPKLARNFAALPECELHGLWDIDAGRLGEAARRHPSARAYRSLEEILADPLVDAVAIAAPGSRHHELARAFLLAGKHVLLEKPMAFRTAHCAELNRLARAAGLVLMIDHTFLFADPVRFISGALARGELGDLRYVGSRRMSPAPPGRDCGVAWDLAPHDISIMLALFGALPETVSCRAASLVGGGFDDVANISLSFGPRQFATIQCSLLEPRKVREMTVVGTERTIVFDDVEPVEKIRIHGGRRLDPPRYHNSSALRGSHHFGDCLIPRLPRTEPLANMCARFIAAVTGAADAESDGEFGARVVAVLEACDRSRHLGGAAVPVAAPNPEREPLSHPRPVPLDAR